MLLSREDKLAAAVAVGGVACLFLLARREAPLLPNASHVFELDGVPTWTDEGRAMLRAYLAKADLDSEQVGTVGGQPVFETEEGEKFYSVTPTLTEKRIMSGAAFIGFLLSKTADLAVWTTQDVARLKMTRADAAPKPGWVLLATGTDRGGF